MDDSRVALWPHHVLQLALYVLEIANECAHSFGVSTSRK